MIKTFHDKNAEALFNDRSVLRFKAIERIIRRKLFYLHGAKMLQDLLIPPANRLEGLSGDRAGPVQHSS